ncbi:pentapeptide repeat-containing protein [Actinomadura xylanilytica]|uniref:pentapeptide repeat-containing protein n=1 Tax=Actinomadura xylanilytica TaxID=887459 RepID=UPI00255B2A7F|nr:pentapeptide repeat-containing protein [Actinomadura xylanilytica]MDL4773779.1 pentapeptide repeat-containing protein [Actinomadura xylanilytica]
MAEPPGLNDAERRLWTAFPTGTAVVLGDERPAGPHPDRMVRAEVICRLLLGAVETRPGFVAAVRLHGAYIIGRLDISGGSVAHELRLENCRLVEAPDFSNAQTRQLRLSDCTMPGFDGGGLRADGYLSLSGSVIDGEVRMPRAQLAGGLRMNGTKVTVTDPARWALFSGGLVVDVGAFIRNAEFTGGVRLVGARMNGGLFMDGTTLRNPGRLALDAENMVVEDAAEFSNGFRGEGTVRLRNARFDGILSFSKATLDSCDPGRMALHASHIQADELILWPQEKIKGRVSLSYSRIAVIMDHPDIWPDELWLNGLTYETLRGGMFQDRLRWVARDEQFHLQPYEQLANWYHGIGHDDLARKVQLAKLRARRRRLNPVARGWNHLLDWTVGYGYRPWLAFMWFAVLLAIGTTVFTLERPASIKPPEERPLFHALVYSLDLLIPIDTFGQQSSFDPHGWSRWVAYSLVATGWVLATALIAGVTRVLRPN